MKLFKNKVGRPSNEIKNKRRLLVSIVIVLSLVLIGTVTYSTITLLNNKENATAKISFKRIGYFHYNGPGSETGGKVRCVGFASCKVKAPSVKVKNGYTFLGWNTDENATTASVKAGDTVKLKKDTHYYAIAKKSLTATFYSNGLDYLEAKTRRCYIYNNQTSCRITLPIFNKIGRFNAFWSEKSIASSNLKAKGIKWDSSYFRHVGSYYTLTKDITLYPNFNDPRYEYNILDSKYRNLEITKTIRFGKTIVEFDKKLSSSQISEGEKMFNKIYKSYPWLMAPC